MGCGIFFRRAGRYWANFSKFIVSLLKAGYGDAASPENDFGFSWLPRVDADYSQLAFFDRMAKGKVKGYFLTGQNPAGGGPNAGLHRAGLRNLDWLVVLDWFETESAVFWKNDPNAPPPSEIKTELFFIPAASLRQGMSDPVNPPRPDRRAARAGPQTRGGTSSTRCPAGVPLWRRR
jgi:formate dehydrogenase major subunit